MKVTKAETVIRVDSILVEMSRDEAKEIMWTMSRAADLCCVPGECDACRPLKKLAAYVEVALGEMEPA